MNSTFIRLLLVALAAFGITYISSGTNDTLGTVFIDDEKDSAKSDTGKLKYPFRDKKPYDLNQKRNPFDLKDPEVLKKDVEYDPETNTYTERRKLGDRDLYPPKSKSFSDYLDEIREKEQQDYFKTKSKATNSVRSTGNIPDLINIPPVIDRLFGGGLIDIRPSGSAEATFGGNYNVIRNPQIPVRQQRTGTPDFKIKMQVAVNGQIGDKLKINTNYDTDATFEFENQIKLNWVGEEDDILKKIELGNVSLPLNGSLIQAGQSLFGVKTQMQFGKLMVTTIATQQRGQTTETEVSGGAQVTKFDIQANNYEANRHFFVGQFFKDQYDNALSILPTIQSGAYINYIEVWVTNRNKSFNDNRNLVPIVDLGESDPYNPNLFKPLQPEQTHNEANVLWEKIIKDPALNSTNTVIDQFQKSQYANLDMKVGVDYNILLNGRRLTDQEFTVHRQLGYISLNQSLNNDEILAVAYEYTYNGRVFKVGQLSRDNPPGPSGKGNDLVVKMLKSTITNTRWPLWDLMMKNIYSLNTYNVQRQDFTLNVVYADDKTADLNYLPVNPKETQIFEKQLITVLNLDKINKQEEAKPDGVYDLLDGTTINMATGRIIFPVREPFGAFLRSKFQDPNGKDASFYAFDALYDSTKWWAEQDVTHNKFFLRGSYRGSASNEISLNAINVPEGSVRVTANGAPLTENTDFIVDYNLGRVRIINEGIINSGAVIKVSSESNSLFTLQQKTLVGSRFDYTHNRNLLLGGTIMHMTERPLTPKVDIGQEPILNTIVGLDGTWNKETRFLTKLVDMIPFIETKEKSSVMISGEVAKIFPHNANTIGARGTSFLDDFEGAETPFELKNVYNWKFAPTPQGQNDLFPESAFDSSRGYKRANIQFHTIDLSFNSSSNNNKFIPGYINGSDKSHPFVRAWALKEVFPQLNIQMQQINNISTLDLMYYPKQRGIYNYNSSINDFNADGTFSKPKESWGGIARKVETNDFEAANIDYIEFWMMDPFCMDKNSTNSGQLYINIGNISEDLNSDNRRAVENGLPIDGSTVGTDSTRFGRVAQTPPQIQAFDNNAASRPNQDKGLDGLNSAEERVFFAGYLENLKNNFGAGSKIYTDAFNDPSSDDYRHYLDPEFDGPQKSILGRYSLYNGMEGNSSLATLPNGSPASATTLPDDEDINKDQTPNFNEEYFQYKIDISANSFKVGSNFVTDSIRTQPNYVDPSGYPATVTWYQFKVPIRLYDKKVGGIQDFKSIRFMRLFLKGFDDSIMCRFGKMQLVRAEWRRYLKNLNYPPGVGPNLDPNDQTEFIISAVNIEKNSQRVPIPYVVPPGIVRENDPTQQNSVQLNEQALSLRACGLKKGDSRAAYKTLNFDIRNYKTMKMFIHAEGENIMDGDVRAFLRIGTDLERNYYQLEIPLKITQPGTSNPSDIWPEINELNIDLEKFQQVKLNRNNVTTDVTTYYEEVLDNGNVISVVGQPDLSNVRTIMLGIKNPLENDNLEICPEVWFNELRLQDFVNTGGYAANARIVTNLADFGKVNLTGSYQSIGFGGVDKRLNQRNLNETITYDIQSSFELGKFFPQRSGITIPMFIGYNETRINPKYYPLNPDVLLKTALKSAQTQAEKDRIKENAQDFTSRYSLNFTNVKKNKVGSSKAHVYDIENFNISYSYQKIYRRNQIIEDYLQQTYRASLGYNFSDAPKPWKPFRSLKPKILNPFKGFGMYFKPQSITMRFDVDRRYSETQNRNNDNFKAIVPRLYDKTFLLTRVYGFNYNLTNNLKFDYQATVNARVEEPVGALETKAKKDTVWSNFLGLGKTNDFNQIINATYNVPIDKIRFLNWVKVSTRYSANMNWRTAPPAAASLGNTLQNSQTISINNQLNFTSFYNKFPLLRRANQPVPVNRRKGKGDDEDDPKKKKEGMNAFARTTLGFITMLKQFQLDYNITNGTTLPGYTRGVDYLGHNQKYNTPGAKFILGFQDPEIRYKLAEGGHLSTNPLQINRYIQLEGVEMKGSATVEPFNSFRINLNFERRFSNTTSSTFRYDPLLRDFDDQGLMEAGMFSISTITWKTAFEKINDDFQSDAYDQFQKNRMVIAKKVQAEELSSKIWESRNYIDSIGVMDDSTGFPLGIDRNHQDVIMYSFLAAYQGKDANSFKLDRFPLIPLPSWRITWNGLSKLDFIKRYFSNVTLSHAYNSTTSIGNFNTSANYGQDSLVRGENLQPKYQFTTISIIERFSPLIRVNLTLNSGLTLNFELKTDRSLNLSTSYIINETHNKEYVFGIGYRKAGVILPFKINGKKPMLKNDLDFRFDFSYRDGYVITRNINADVQQTPTAGMKSISIRPTINYNINENLNFRAFYNRNVNTPRTSQSFPTALTNFGISLRYTLQ
ncbi:MAG: cell surface protein SprA [Flavobacteriales bacterium]|nr:cell surface protein SprA [Flavobacteriales bacterium]